MLKMIAIVIVVIVAAILVTAATQPDTFRVQRSIAIQAPPEKIFPYINDFKQWTLWSPYEKRDPTMKRTYSEVTNGQGATYGWAGNKDIGVGDMKITESSPPGRVALDLNFSKPFEAHNTVEFVLVPGGGTTTVSWTMQGPANFISKIMGVFIDMDKMVGKDFEVGLANLKSAAEK